MARRSQLFTMMPWSGGINDSSDPGAIPSNDLVRADNVVHSTSGARIKRPGFAYVDAGDLPAVSSITLTSNVVTLVFASSVNTGTNNILVAGEKITVACTTNSAFNITDTAISTVSTTTITYPLVHADIATVNSPSITVTRSSTIVGIHDFWYHDNLSNTKSQLIVALTSQGKLFKYTGVSSATRLELTKTTYEVTGAEATDIFTLNSHGLYSGCAVTFSSLTGGAGLSVGIVYYVEKITSGSNTFYLSESLGGSRINITTDLTASAMCVPFALTLPINECDFKVFNEKLFITADGLKNWPIMFDPIASATTYTYNKGANPNASVLQIHEGRLIMNDKVNKDRIYYSAPYDHTKWQGHGSSGTVDIGTGDGDPKGVISILPPFKGALFVSKSRSLYRLPDPGIAFSRVELVSNGIGAVAHKGAASVDMDDVLFISDRGFHSLATTNAYGDFSASFLSDKIQNSFSNFTQSRKSYTWGQYFSQINSVLWTVAQDSATAQDYIWVYNVKFKEWSRWTGLAPSCITQYKTSSKDRLLIATTDCRLAYLTESTYNDFDGDNINYYIRTGKIYVDNNPNSVKTFRRIGFLFPPQGNFSFTVTVKVDNQTIDTQYPDGNLGAGAFTISKSASGDLLGSTFILGQSLLSYSANLDPFMRPIDGVGRGLTVTIQNDAADEQVEIYGLIVEYTPAGLAQETMVTDGTSE